MPGYSQTSSVPFDLNVLTGLAVTGSVIKIFFSQPESNDGVTGPASSAIWGYGVMALSLLGIVVTGVALASRESMNASLITFLKNVWAECFPTLLLLSILAWVISMNSTFFKRINQGKVAPEYAGFSTLSTVTIILQLFVLLKYLRSQSEVAKDVEKKETVLAKIAQTFSAEMGTFTYILTTMNLIVAGVMQVILSFFSTDG